MKTGKTVTLFLTLGVLFVAAKVRDLTPEFTPNGPYPESKLGWKLAVQTSTFRRFTFFESIDKIKACGLSYVEGFTGQEIGGGLPGKTDYHMDKATRDKILQMLREKGVKFVAYGVVTPHTEADWRQLFDFGKAMGIETFTSEPDASDLPLVSKLCDDYKINVAIHNHAKPTHYWSPDSVLKALNGQSKRVGACADIGHWLRSGLDPVDCLKKLDGHIVASHMKDLNEKDNKQAHDVHWGTGAANIAGVIQELKKQHFTGVISAEYEYNRDEIWYDSVPDIAASISNFRSKLNGSLKTEYRKNTKKN